MLSRSKGRWLAAAIGHPFRGRFAAGVAEKQELPLHWNAATGEGILYRVPIPGLAHSSPIAFGDHVFVTTAVSSEAEVTFKPGLYGTGDASADRSVDEWQVLCLDGGSGKILWQKAATKGVPKDKRHSKITAPTPIFSDDLFIVASGRAPERPVFAIRAGAKGDITLKNNETSNASVAWSLTRRGPYMPTPLIFDGRVYVLSNDGPFACYDLKSGAEIYRLRLPHRGDGFSASPVAADGRIYLASESGNVFVIKAGDEFEMMATNEIGESMMATPAISGGRMFIRGAKHLFAIGVE